MYNITRIVCEDLFTFLLSSSYKNIFFIREIKISKCNVCDSCVINNFILFTFQSLTVRDTVRECLEKDPCERTEDDIEVLLEFMQHLPVSAVILHFIKVNFFIF